MNESRLDKLREELAALDRQIIRAAARRRDVAMQIGREKEGLGRATRDFTQEARVLGRAREFGAELGLTAEFCDRLMLDLIGVSLEVQEKDRVVMRRAGEGRRTLIIGGAGRMGRWFARFLDAQGYRVEIADPAGDAEGFPSVSDWEESALDQDMIVVAASLGNTGAVMDILARRRPGGIIFDLASLKTPFGGKLTGMVESGLRVTSIHPMFGPSTDLLSGRHVILVDVGCDEANAVVRRLFEDTMATLVEMNIEEHDRSIAYVLGLSHALNIVFFNALKESGESLPRLNELSSTTFDAQLSIARQVASENPDMYYEIQSLNEFGDDALQSLDAAVESLRSAVTKKDRDAFVALMRGGAELFEGWGAR